MIKADFTKKMEQKREKLIAKGEHERAKHVYPTGNPFLDLCICNGRFPSSKARFCTADLKIRPIQNFMKTMAMEGKSVINWSGERAEESEARSKRPVKETWFTSSNGGSASVYRPILRWKQQDCFNKLKQYGIEPNPLYAKGFTRVGCFPCIMCRKNELRLIAETCPEVIDKIKAWEERVSLAAAPDAFSTFFHPSKCGGGFGIEAATEWSKTSRGGKQYQLELEE